MNSLTEFEIRDGVLTKYHGAGPDAVIPEGVNAIGEYAFQNCDPLVRVFVADGVSEIGPYAFSGCANLEHVSFPTGLSRIGEHAFYKCSRLEEAPLPRGLKRLGGHAFEHCGSLRRAVIPRGIRSLEDGSFMWCRSLSELSLPAGLSRIGDRAFSWCTSLRVIDLPDSVKHIGGEAFRGCGKLEKIRFPKGAFSTGQRAFSGCRRLAGSDGLVVVNGTVYDYCGPGGKVGIPEGVREIGSYAFYSCRELSEIVFPESIEQAGEYAFCGCAGLKGVYSPSLDSWCRIAFSNMSSNPLSCGAAMYVNGTRADIVNIPEGTANIGSFAFSGSGYLSRVTIPGSVKSVGECAFSECSALSEAVLEEGVEEIGKDAFYGCVGLKSISLPVSLRRVGDRAFLADRVHVYVKLWTRAVSRALASCSVIRVSTLNISAVPDKYKPASALGFVSDADTDASPLRIKTHTAYLSRNSVRLCPLSFDEPELLYYLCDNRMIKPGHLDLFMQEADRRGIPELSSLLLSYQDKLGYDTVRRARARKERAAETYMEMWLERSAARPDPGSVIGVHFAVGSDLYRWSRDAFRAFLSSRGAVLDPRVTVKTDYYITNGGDAFSGNTIRALELGVPTLSEEELFKMCGS